MSQQDKHKMISLQHITKVFNKGKVNEVTALHDVSLEINAGEFVIVIGANGSGKTALLNVIGGAAQPTAGIIEINKTNVTALPEHKRSKWVARVFQNPYNGTAPDLTILDNFRLAALRTKQKKISVGINAAFKRTVQEKIALLGMGLENKVERLMGSLSGGQRQALTLLMSIMDDTSILLLDEPTAALDPKTAQVILNIADKLIKDFKLTALLVTHNLKDAQQYGNRLIQMREGKIERDLNTEAKEKLLLPAMYKWFE
jgi:putative ABC transport system ATP-binding protein